MGHGERERNIESMRESKKYRKHEREQEREKDHERERENRKGLTAVTSTEKYVLV